MPGLRAHLACRPREPGCCIYLFGAVGFLFSGIFYFFFSHLFDSKELEKKCQRGAVLGHSTCNVFEHQNRLGWNLNEREIFGWTRALGSITGEKKYLLIFMYPFLDLPIEIEGSGTNRFRSDIPY